MEAAAVDRQSVGSQAGSQCCGDAAPVVQAYSLRTPGFTGEQCATTGNGGMEFQLQTCLDMCKLASICGCALTHTRTRTHTHTHNVLQCCELCLVHT